LAAVLRNKYWGDKVKKNEMGGACGAYGGEDRSIKASLKKHEGKKSPEIPCRRWLNNIKLDIQEVGWTGLVWLRIGTSGGLF
jgi:hypothetical protein